MKASDLAVSRQGNLAVINHKEFRIEFNLSNGTWDYIDGTGYTIIKNGYTKLTLGDGSVVTTEDTGTCEFMTDVVPSGPDATDKHVQQVRFSHEAKGKGIRLNIYVSCSLSEPHIELKVGVENLKEASIELDSLTLLGLSAKNGGLQLGGPPSNYYIFLNMLPTVPGGFQKLYDGFQLSEEDAIDLCHNGVLHDTESKRAFVFGFLTTEQWWPHVQVGYQKADDVSSVNLWSLYHKCEGRSCRQGEEITSESAYLNFSKDATSSYEHYTALLAAQNKAQRTSQIISGWSLASQVGRGTKRGAAPDKPYLTAKSILEQTDRIVQNPLFQPGTPGGIDYIHLDAIEGTRNSDGTWVLNAEDFPDGMSAVVNEIRSKGFKTSLRINLFCEAVKSELFQKHPRLFLQEVAPPSRRSSRGKNSSLQSRENFLSNSKRGRPRKASASPVLVRRVMPGEKEGGLLDVSHPDAQAYIRQQIKQIISEWKYDLIKADFSGYTTVLSSARNLRWHDSSLTSIQLYRLALQLVKDAVRDSGVSDKAVLVAGYNVITAPCIGGFPLNFPLVGGEKGTMPTDGSHFWHRQRGTKHRISRHAVHLSEHNVLWSHVFGELAVDEPRPINEAILEMTAAALSGGALFCGDAVATLKPHRAELLAKLFPLLGKAATPVDLYENPFPRVWHLKMDAQSGPYNIRESTLANHLVAIFNWDDKEDDAYFDLDALGLPESKDYLVHDFWMRQYLGTVSSSLTLLNISPRSAKLLSLREAFPTPQLLATDMHYTQGSVEILSAGWDSQSESYLLVCKPIRQAEGTCFIHVPADYLPIGVSAYGSDYRYSWDKPICRITFGRTEKLVHANIRFSKTSGGSL